MRRNQENPSKNALLSLDHVSKKVRKERSEPSEIVIYLGRRAEAVPLSASSTPITLQPSTRLCSHQRPWERELHSWKSWKVQRTRVVLCCLWLFLHLHGVIVPTSLTSKCWNLSFGPKSLNMQSFGQPFTPRISRIPLIWCETPCIRWSFRRPAELLKLLRWTLQLLLDRCSAGICRHFCEKSLRYNKTQPL